MTFRDELRSALARIASVAPEKGDYLSETALVLSAVENGPELRLARDLYRSAFELLADAGFVCRAGHMWCLKRTFRSGDIETVLDWRGLSKCRPVVAVRELV